VNRLDRAVVAVLALVLVVLGGVIATPRQPAGSDPGAQALPTPDLTMPPPITLREGVVGMPTSITPVTMRSRADRVLVGLVFSGLVRLGPGTTYQPDLAESWTTDDTGSAWTFTIRSDAVWQDGIPVTADDVVYTVGALQSPDATGAASGAWADVTVEALDERTVRLTLGTPIAGVLALATQPLLPAHLLADVPYAELATSEFAQLPLGSGPFALLEVDGQGATLVPASGVVPPEPEEPDGGTFPTPSGDSLASPLPQPSAGLPRPYLDGLQIRFYPDEAALAAALESREVDVASGLSATTMAGVAADASLQRLVYPKTTLSAVLLNLRPTHEELRDETVRRALLGAIDRDRLVADALGGNATRADALIPPTSGVYDATAAGTVAYDPKAAGKALEKAGWTRKGGQWVAPGDKTPYELEVLSIPSSANPRLAMVADSVRSAWRTFGFNVKAVTVKAADLATRLRDGTFTAAVVDIAEGLEPDLYPLLATTQVQSTGSNLAGYQDPTLDPLLEAARAPGTQEERLSAWKSLLEGLAARAPILPLAWIDEIMLARGLEGVTPRLIVDTGDRYWDVLAWRLAADR
jgi:peptide/nickel transport system substrate-binding protein